MVARYRATLSSPERDAMLDLARKHGVVVLDHGLRGRGGGVYSADAIIQDTDVPGLEALGYAVQLHEDVDATAEERRREVGRGNRYSQPPRPSGSD